MDLQCSLKTLNDTPQTGLLELSIESPSSPLPSCPFRDIRLNLPGKWEYQLPEIVELKLRGRGVMVWGGMGDRVSHFFAFLFAAAG